MNEKTSTTVIAKKEKVENTPTAEKKGQVEAEKGKVEVEKGKAEEVKAETTVEVQPKAEEQKPEQSTSRQGASKQEVPKLEIPKSLNMAYLYSEIQAVKQIVQEHGQQIADIQEALARKRKPVANGKIQIKDKKTGKTYPSKNNCYQSLLKAGELKELVDKGIFGDNPEKNTFGWYALVRSLPDRFEEIKAEEKIIDGK